VSGVPVRPNRHIAGHCGDEREGEKEKGMIKIDEKAIRKTESKRNNNLRLLQLQSNRYNYNYNP